MATAKNKAIPTIILSAKEAAVYLRVSPNTLAKKRVEGTGPPFVKVFGRIMYERDVLDAFIAQGRRQSTSDTGTADARILQSRVTAIFGDDMKND